MIMSYVFLNCLLLFPHCSLIYSPLLQASFYTDKMLLLNISVQEANVKTVEIKPGIFWVGAIDWAVRDFHGYVTPKGTTYNNYLIMDEQVTLVDTVKSDFSRVTIDNIRNLVDPSRIVNLVINHIEPDHASSIARIMALVPGATIYITSKGKKGLDRHFDTSKWNFKIVKSGDTLNTGQS